MKLYKTTFFLLIYFILINPTFGNAQNIGYLRIIDNSDKNNDYKDCQYNRFDDLLITNMINKEINIIDIDRKSLDDIKKDLGYRYSTEYFLGMLGLGHKGSKNLRKKLKMDYIIFINLYNDLNSIKDIEAKLICGSDEIYKYDYWKKQINFSVLDLNKSIEKGITLKINLLSNENLTPENFNDKTNVNNFIKDILDLIQNAEGNKKNNIEKSESKSNSVKINNNNISISNRNNFSNPRIMVLPKKIEEKNYKNGEYYLNKEEKMIITSLKKVLEDNKLKTIGFESVIKDISERRLLQSGTKEDLKTLILKSNEADFYVEFENLGSNEKTEAKSNNQSTSQSNQNFQTTEVSGDEFGAGNVETASNNYGNCPQSIDFKIRNYATSEDIASDLQEINTCGSVDEYKKFANKILNNGAISKIKDEFQYLIENGIKISVFFTFSEASNKKFDDKIQGGIRISQHIEKCIKDNAFNGNFILGGVVNNYMSFPQVAIPFRDKNNGQIYTTNQFSNVIRDYLENYLEVKEVTVTGSSINLILN